MSSTVSAKILRKCSIVGKENGVSKAILFENLSATNSAAQLELALEELLSKGELVKVRRDRKSPNNDSCRCCRPAFIELCGSCEEI